MKKRVSARENIANNTAQQVVIEKGTAGADSGHWEMRIREELKSCLMDY